MKITRVRQEHASQNNLNINNNSNNKRNDNNNSDNHRINGNTNTNNYSSSSSSNHSHNDNNRDNQLGEPTVLPIAAKSARPFCHANPWRTVQNDSRAVDKLFTPYHIKTLRFAGAPPATNVRVGTVLLAWIGKGIARVQPG